ncbi:MAG: SpvB/TcaC N-terminal domain-containing protein [Bacteroidia bacterium]
MENQSGNKSVSSPSFKTDGGKTKSNAIEVPSISLPKGGGAIKSIDEKFSINAANGTAGFSIPFPFSPSRNGFMPGMSLSYNSGSGKGIFGLGWNAEPPSITRKTEKKLPEYNDEEESDVFIFSGAEDLVPALKQDINGTWNKEVSTDGSVKRYKPRIEGGFARIEKITEANGNVYWKVTSKDNVVSIFGKSKSAQIYNRDSPNNTIKIFKWFLEFSYDDKGNCFQLEYKTEDKVGVDVTNHLHEKNRINDFSKCTNTYLKRIKYCNTFHFNRSTIDLEHWDNFIQHGNDYLLELVLDYGEHDILNPQPDDTGNWTCRLDPFSDYRSGFDIRTYRLCNRLLMFHHFGEPADQPLLVRSIEFEYDNGTAFTFLKSIRQKGFIRKTDGSYTDKSLPPIEFNYEPLGWNTDIKSLPKESLENLPVGIDDQSYQWIDLHGEGLSGILTEQGGGWYYKSNSGDGNFDGVKLVSPKPAFSGLTNGALHFQDVEANGQKFLVSNDLNGYFEYSPDDEWLPFKTFNEVPNISLHDSNLKFLDLNGDGKADILITEDDTFVWYASKGREGFDSSRTSRKNFDEEKGPAIVFADSTQSIVIADMSGDGLMDIVRIRCNDIVYWPNLGYGKFGAKVSMSNAPRFDHPDHFNPKYIKLADVDGSGTTDIVYLANDSFKIYFNQSGNSWSEENIVHGVNPLPFPKTDDHTNVNIIDLLGNGTGCIVWSSPLPAYSGNPLRYIDLMNGKKPHIMTSYKNNMGKEVTLHYKPSTFFYLEDKKAGNPWITKLPFPVQCVRMVEAFDQITKTRFTNSYSYHHGYYDYKEREFRGFGRVDQTDTERFEDFKKHADAAGQIQLADDGFFEPPILTKTWFHTGAFLDKEKIFNHFKPEYYQNTDAPEKKLTEPVLPADWTTDEMREALRACKGMTLHVEVYSLDNSPIQIHPYTTTHHTCNIQMLQPKANNAHAIFIVHESEALTYAYERDPSDPRIAHAMNIEIDEYGNVIRSAAISYGRNPLHPDLSLTAGERIEQGKINIIYTENSFTVTANPDTTLDPLKKIIDDANDYRLQVLFETKNYELTGFEPGADNYFSIEELAKDLAGTSERSYEALSNGSHQKRLIEHVKTQFLKNTNDLSDPLPFGIMESLLLPYQSYQLALTPALVTDIFGTKVDDALLTGEGKYVKFTDDNYWIASGIQTFDATNFYQVTEVTDPFGHRTWITYEPLYRFYLKTTRDELGNESSVLNFNFRTLSPYVMKDINDNRTGVRTDELGMVISTFVLGKETEQVGDEMYLTSVELSTNDHSTNLLEYHLFNYKDFGKPNFVKTKVSDTYYRDQLTGSIEQIYESYAYSDGSGNVVMTKVQAEPGDALNEDENGIVTTVTIVAPDKRWVGNGRTILNNKGKPVKQYEPYFSTTCEYEDSKNLVERGVTPIIIYDAAGRVIKTIMPDGTFTSVEFDPWKLKSYDQNDNVVGSDWFISRTPNPPPTNPTSEQTAALKAKEHNNTPTISYLDSLGRNFLTVADNVGLEKYKTIVETDIEGNLRSVTDACENIVMQYKYDMLGNQLYSLSMDAGERWVVSDAIGKQMYSWAVIDNRKFKFDYDTLHRPIGFLVSINNGAFKTFEKIEYGEALTNGKELNLRGKPYQHFDTAGIAKIERCDFKGNALKSSRQLLKNYKADVNWDVINVVTDLETEIFISETDFDALNRPVKVTTPHTLHIIANTITPVYNQANLLNEVKVSVRGAAESSYVKDIDYNEKGQRKKILYGNDVLTTYEYDKKTFRLKNIHTTSGSASTVIQDIFYTYDPVGNITNITDKSQPTIFHSGEQVDAINDYTYDAIYRLITATGREHTGQNGLDETAGNRKLSNFPFTNTASLYDVNAMRKYTQRFAYDKVGNIRSLAHRFKTGGYTRTYAYNNNDAEHNTYSAVACATKNNQLLATIIGSLTHTYNHDAHGSIKTLPHLHQMQWNLKDQLQWTQKTAMASGGGETTYYVYDGSGQRIRKITEWQNTNHKKEERIYLGGFEIYRSYKYGGVTIELERETLHVMDDKKRIALVETKTKHFGSNDTTTLNTPLPRYQLDNHLGSASLELDATAQIISYEEYHPYGTTSYQRTDKLINPIAKRYRYTGMERDEESGLAYHSARYYMPWLGRWLSVDPIGIGDGLNIYQYVHNSPIELTDSKGTEGEASSSFSLNVNNRSARLLSKDDYNGIPVMQKGTTEDMKSLIIVNNPRAFFNGSYNSSVLINIKPYEDNIPVLRLPYKSVMPSIDFDPKIEIKYSIGLKTKDSSDTEGSSAYIQLLPSAKGYSKKKIDFSKWDSKNTIQSWKGETEDEFELAGGRAGVYAKSKEFGPEITLFKAEYAALNAQEGSLYGNYYVSAFKEMEMKAGRGEASVGFNDLTLKAKLGADAYRIRERLGVQTQGYRLNFYLEARLGFEIGFEMGKKASVSAGFFGVGFEFGSAKGKLNKDNTPEYSKPWDEGLSESAKRHRLNKWGGRY